MRCYAESWVAMALLEGHYVHWVDGACRFNPERILKSFPSSLDSPHELLHSLFIGRGFTVHQFTNLIERLGREIAITGSPLVIVDGPITMHLDSQIKGPEARSLLRTSLNRLRKIAEENNVAIVVLTSNRGHSQRHQNLLAMVSRRCSQSLEGRIEKIRGGQRMWLSHQPSGSTGLLGQSPSHSSSR